MLPFGFPEVKVHPTNVHTKRDSVDFNCCVTGTPPFHFKWYFNRNPIEADNGLHVVSQNVRKGEMFCSNLKVTNATSSKGFYQCVVMNDIGQVVSKGAKIAFHEVIHEFICTNSLKILCATNSHLTIYRVSANITACSNGCHLTVSTNRFFQTAYYKLVLMVILRHR